LRRGAISIEMANDGDQLDAASLTISSKMTANENGVRPLSLEASLIVIVLSSLGLWAAICAALSALVSVLLESSPPPA